MRCKHPSCRKGFIALCDDRPVYNEYVRLSPVRESVQPDSFVRIFLTKKDDEFINLFSVVCARLHVRNIDDGLDTIL